MRKFLLTSSLIISFFNVMANGIDKAYAALHEFDYFKAKKLFFKNLKKSRVEAAYGLATIFFRNDNPFHNLDSSYKYIQICKQNFPLKKNSKYVNNTLVRVLHDSISERAYQRFLRNISVQSAEKYAGVFYESKHIDDALCKRDSILFNELKNTAKSKPLYDFIECYPRSCYLEKVRQIYDYNLYEEITAQKNDAAYLNYIHQYPLTKYTQQAKQELLEYYVKNKNEAGIYSYIKNINASYYAWNALFSVSVKNYSEKNLQAFLKKYPDYPDKKQLEEEFVFWKIPFFLIKQANLFGFVDSSGKICVEPVYTDAEDFKEGYALAQKNNLYGFINKAGRIKIDFQFDEASSFSQQAAIVKKNNHTFLIDHAGKQISAVYDEIADFTDNVAIVKKQNVYGAINHNGEEVIKPVYSSLSDFSENVAAFTQNNVYGLINKQGITIVQPKFTWVSGFKENQYRVKVNNRFGVINKKGDFIIEPLYDFIDEPYKGIYVVVKDNLYGFIDSSGCYFSEVKYAYNPSLKPTSLTNGTYMRLMKDNKEELQDKNGIKYYSQQKLSDVQLTNTDVMSARTKNKVQFYRLLKTSPQKKVYNKVSHDDEYWYAKNDRAFTLLELSLKRELFSVKDADDVRKLNDAYFSYTTDDGTGMLNKNGAVVLQAFFDEITPTQQADIFYIERNEKGAYYNASALKFIWQETGFNANYIADEE